MPPPVRPSTGSPPPICRWSYERFYQSLRAALQLPSAPFLRVRVEGARPDVDQGGIVLCANHESYFDPAFIQFSLRRRVVFVMTNDFYKVPGISWFFKMMRAIPVARGRMARKGLRRAMALIRAGHAVAIFPEGRLTSDGALNRAQRGIARIARRTGAPVFPIALVGARRAWPRGARLPRPAHVRIRFGRPMRWPAHAGTGRDRERDQAFADDVMARIASLRDTANHPLTAQ